MSKENFIAQIAPIIQRHSRDRGFRVCSAAIAQACLESNYGESGLVKYHNYFGLKCGSSWKGKSVNMKTKEEYTKGILTTIKDNFRAYDSMEEGVKGYYDFLNAKRYANLKNATTARQYLELIKAAGYATASKYVDSNMAVVNKYNLTKYDVFSASPANSDSQPETSKKVGIYEVGKTYTLNSNMVVRKSPGGAKVRFEDLTESGKTHGHVSEDGGAVLEKGTRVTCKDAVNKEGQIWIKIPSGWVCAVGKSGVRFVE